MLCKHLNFSPELAEEFGMLYVPGFTMEDFYINAYGYDLRELDFAFKYTRNKSFDEKLFAQDPTANDHGLDRMLYYSHVCRFTKYVEMLAHLFNTGQGVVTERSPHSDWVYFEAAYQQASKRSFLLEVLIPFSRAGSQRPRGSITSD